VSDGRVRQLIKLAQDMVILHGEQLATCSVLITASEQAGRE